jgi:hypothetical protein
MIKGLSRTESKWLLSKLYGELRLGLTKLGRTAEKRHETGGSSGGFYNSYCRFLRTPDK